MVNEFPLVFAFKISFKDLPVGFSLLILLKDLPYRLQGFSFGISLKEFPLVVKQPLACPMYVRSSHMCDSPYFSISSLQIQKESRDPFGPSIRLW